MFSFPQSRRQFFTTGGSLLGGAALTSLVGDSAAQAASRGAVLPHFAPRARQVIYLHMVGGPSQMDLFDYKPAMAKWYDKDLPESIRKGQRLTTMTSGQTPAEWCRAAPSAGQDSSTSRILVAPTTHSG